MKNRIKLFASVFIVSWQTGVQYQAVPCPNPQPADIVCAKGVPQRTEKTFKTSLEADAFRAGLVAEGTKEGIKLEEVKK